MSYTPHDLTKSVTHHLSYLSVPLGAKSLEQFFHLVAKFGLGNRVDTRHMLDIGVDDIYSNTMNGVG